MCSACKDVAIPSQACLQHATSTIWMILQIQSVRDKSVGHAAHCWAADQRAAQHLGVHRGLWCPQGPWMPVVLELECFGPPRVHAAIACLRLHRRRAAALTRVPKDAILHDKAHCCQSRTASGITKMIWQHTVGFNLAGTCPEKVHGQRQLDTDSLARSLHNVNARPNTCRAQRASLLAASSAP